MSLRVVHACAYFAPAFVYGGPPRSLLGLSRAQLDAGLTVRVVTTSANGKGELDVDHDLEEYDGVPVQYCRRRWPPALFYSPQYRAAVEAACAQADVLHIHGLWNAAVWTAADVAARRNIPYVLSPRGMFEPAALSHDRWRKRVAFAAFDRRVLRGAALLHATSSGEAMSLDGLEDREVVCIPNGVERTAPRSSETHTRGRLGLPPGAPVILFLGRIHPLKRLDLLCAAFQLVRESHPDARLVIAGPDETGLRPELERLLGDAIDGVIWTGQVDDEAKWALLDACTTLVLCSDSESFGMSVAEAMVSARPVVVTHSTGWSELSAAGAGVAVESTAAAIADALRQLLADPASSRAMGERGCVYARERLSWRRAAEMLTDAYARVVRS